MGDLEEQLFSLRVGCRYYRSYQTMSDYVKGLLSTAERKNSWQLSEKQGASTPYRFQHMLYNAPINVSCLQVQLAKASITTLGKHGILTFDDTGFLKKGNQSAGVQRQYTGTAGRIENCQIGTFMGYKTDKGHVLLDTRLYIPESWTGDLERCRKAKIPTEVIFAKKALHAVHMYENFKQQGHRCSWVTADEAYGKDPDFIKALEDDKQGYVVAISKDYHVRCGDLRQKLPAFRWAEKEDQNTWQRLSAGAGSKGERLYDWLLIKRTEMTSRSGFERFLLARRSIGTGELAYYSVFSPMGEDISTFVKVAGSRWSIEECFEMAKGETGLDHYEVRTYHGWERHMILSMWALYLLVFLKDKMNGREASAALKDDIIPREESQETSDKLTMDTRMDAFKKKRKMLSHLRFKK